MGRKRHKTKGFQWVREDQQEDALEPVVRQSHREGRQEDAAVEALALRLLATPQKQRSHFPLSEPLMAVLAEHDRIVGAARNRHLRHVKKTLRAHDMPAIEAALDQGSPEEQRMQRLERWRTRIIQGDDTDIQAFVEAHPTADRAGLRSRARAARKEGPIGLRAAKQLFQALKSASKAG